MHAYVRAWQHTLGEYVIFLRRKRCFVPFWKSDQSIFTSHVNVYTKLMAANITHSTKYAPNVPVDSANSK